MLTDCGHCGARFEQAPVGRTAKFCSTSCRKKAAYRRRLPAEMVNRKAWTRRAGKRPIMLNGRAASTTDPGTWCRYRAASRSTVGDGLGIMLGYGLCCLDLDHCFDVDGNLEPWARREAAKVESPLWVERSLSGDGLHVFFLGEEGRGSRRGGVEWYSRARFIVVTQDRYDLVSA